MLVGRFGDTTGRPYIEGRLVFPRLNLQHNVSFLVDTGADRTVIMPTDAVTLGIDYSALSGNQAVGGIGGNLNMFPEQAAIIFSDPPEGLHLYLIDVLIAPDTPEHARTPSLVGRDILDRWSMTYRPDDETLEFDVISSDLKLPLTPPPPPPPAARPNMS